MKRVEELLKELVSREKGRVSRIILPEAKDTTKMFAAYRIANSGVAGVFEGTAINYIQAEVVLLGKTVKMDGDQETKDLLELSRNVISRLLNDLNAESIQLNESYQMEMKRPVVTLLFNFKGNQ